MAKDLTPALIKRPEYEFTVPEDARLFPEKDIRSFKMRAYTLAQEIDAARGAAGDADIQVAMTMELVRRAVFEVDGQPPSLQWLDEQSPPVRALLGLALNRVSDVKKQVVDDFLASMKAVEG